MFVVANMGGVIVGAVVGAVVIAVIAYFVARAMKGSMKIVLGQKSVASGNTITGTLNVVVKKSILADRMYVGLIGETERVRREHDGDTRRTWEEFYRDEADILVDEQLPAGFSETYEFSLDAPSEAQVMGGREAMSRAADAMGDGAVAGVVKGLAKVAALTNNSLNRRKRWKVVARLETKGVDLAASERIYVSLKQVG